MMIMTKSEVRALQKERRNALSFTEHKLFSDAIRTKLLQTEMYQEGKRLLTFVSFQSEVDTHEIIRQAILDGKRVYLPRVEAHGMEFYEIHDLEGLIPSKFGVLEPPVNVENRYHTVDGEKDLMLLPGLAFDPTGNRIGYGAGYYDRYFIKHTKEHFDKIALAYDFQVMNRIATEEFDVGADVILTPTRIIRCT